MQHRIVLLWLVLGLVIVSGCASEAIPTPTVVPPLPSTTGRALVLGDISDEAIETIEGTQPTADYLATQLSAYGITEGMVKIAPDLETMAQWIANGEVDLYFDSPYPALVMSQQSGAIPVLRRWKYGVSAYHTVFFARKDAGLTSLDQLRGQIIAFEEPFSTSGYMLPLGYLLENGYEVTPQESLETTVADNQIGYVFSTADNTTIQWVVSGRAIAGVVDNVTYERLISAEARQDLIIFAQTEDVPRQLVLVRPGLEPDLQAAIARTLTEMELSTEGQAALETFLTTKFDDFPEGADIALARMRELYELVQRK